MKQLLFAYRYYSSDLLIVNQSIPGNLHKKILLYCTFLKIEQKLLV